MLEAARALGDCLVVCLNDDASVRRLKGPARPLVAAADRAAVLARAGCVDAVVVFGEDTPAALLERLRPDVWAKGGDYAGRSCRRPRRWSAGAARPSCSRTRRPFDHPTDRGGSTSCQRLNPTHACSSPAAPRGWAPPSSSPSRRGGTPIVLDIEAPTTARSSRVDLADARAAEPAVARWPSATGADAVVTAAGIDACGRLEDVPGEDWDRVIAVNLLGTVAVVRAALPALERRSGRVVTVASTLGLPSATRPPTARASSASSASPARSRSRRPAASA